MACKWDFTELFSVPVFTVCQIDISQKSYGKNKSQTDVYAVDWLQKK